MELFPPVLQSSVRAEQKRKEKKEGICFLSHSVPRHGAFCLGLPGSFNERGRGKCAYSIPAGARACSFPVQLSGTNGVTDSFKYLIRWDKMSIREFSHLEFGY